MQSQFQVMPELSPDEYQALKSDISERGVMVPVEYDEDGNVLDGHHRIQICRELGISDWPRITRSGMDEAGKRAHARQLNLSRRHLNQEQRRDLIREQLKDTPELSDRQIAKTLGVDHKTVSGQRTNLEAIGEIPQCDRQTTDGRVYPSIRKPKTSAIHYPGAEKAIVSESQRIRSERQQERRQERIEKLTAIKTPAPELKNHQAPFPIIYADPPWRYEHAESDSRAVENQYPTMSLIEICHLPVSEIAHKDCVLFLWTTSPKLRESMDVLDAWGFEYRTCAIWDKEVIGMGYYFRQQHELLLIATKGSVPVPEPANRPASIFAERRSKHSSKPELAYRLIEQMYPELRKIELFARNQRDGWAAWGNQAA